MREVAVNTFIDIGGAIDNTLKTGNEEGIGKKWGRWHNLQIDGKVAIYQDNGNKSGCMRTPSKLVR